MKLSDVRVSQRLKRCDALVGVELEALFNQVEGVRRRRNEHVCRASNPKQRDRVDHRRRKRRPRRRHVLWCRFPSALQDSLELVHGRVARKARLAETHFSEDAAHGPHIHALCVTRGTKQDLRRTVPTRGNVVSQDRRSDARGLSDRAA